MSDGAKELLWGAVLAATEGREDIRQLNLDSLERLSRGHWPQLLELRWVQIKMKWHWDQRSYRAWKVAEGDRVSILTVDLRDATLNAPAIEVMDQENLQADIRELIRAITPHPQRQHAPKDSALLQDFSAHDVPAVQCIYLLRLAYAAAEHRWKQEAASLVGQALRIESRGFANLEDVTAWRAIQPVVAEFNRGGSRTQFLASCKSLLTVYPNGEPALELQSLVESLQREASIPRPDFLSKRSEDRTTSENVRAWIYELRDAAALRDMTFLTHEDITRSVPADLLIATGIESIPYLIEAIRDETPTRTIDNQPSRRSLGLGRLPPPANPLQHSKDEPCYLLRRQDLALRCLERIVECSFYTPLPGSVSLHRDTPERRAATIDYIRQWWTRSEGKSQAQMIRNHGGVTHTKILHILALLEGPESVVEQVFQSSPEPDDMDGLMHKVNLRYVVRRAFDRFWKHQSRSGDYSFLVKYGDQRTYAELSRRFEETGKLDGGYWNAAEQGAWAARFGQNWAIPILAIIITNTPMTGAHWVNEKVGAVPWSNADFAMENFQKLTGQDFGYRSDLSVQERVDAMARARNWWLEQRHTPSLIAKIEEPHLPVVNPGDLFATDEEIAARVKAIRDKKQRRKIVGSLGEVYTYEVQRALLHALREENVAAERIKILNALKSHPSLWHLPDLARVLRQDRDQASRILAARIIQTVVSDKTTEIWWWHLESRDIGVAAARDIAKDKSQPPEVRRACADVVLAWGSCLDASLPNALARDPVFENYKPIQENLKRQNESGNVASKFVPKD